MSDDDTDPDPIVTRSVLVNEMMDGDGERYLSFDPSTGMEPWDVIGFLDSALIWYRRDLSQMWAAAEDNEDN